MAIQIFPQDTPDVVVDKFQTAQGEVIVNYRAEPYDIGPQTIKLAHTPLTITGLDRDGKPVKNNRLDLMPSIRGTSAGLLTGPNPADCGIFHIGPGCSVEMNGLHLLHEIPPYGASDKAHGSATIANLANNTQESSLKLKYCAIETNATTAISVRSDTAPAAVPANNPVNHIEVRNCQVNGKMNTGSLGGNYSAINLGFWGNAPLDLRKARFEMSNCVLDWSVFGINVWKVLADSHSKLEITRNRVGATAFGALLLFRPNRPGESVVLPKGDIDIVDNIIKIDRYLKLPENLGEPMMGAAGIIVRVSSAEDGEKVKISIQKNEIDMTKLPPPTVPYKYDQPIVYELVPPVANPRMLKNVICHIDHNNELLRAA